MQAEFIELPIAIDAKIHFIKNDLTFRRLCKTRNFVRSQGLGDFETEAY